MKKSTILMLVVIYIAAFFIVGLMGIQLRSHYHVDYLNEIQLEAFEESRIALVKQESVQVNEGQEISEEKKRIQNTYEFKTTTPYTEDMVLKFHVKLVPENTTYSDYKLNAVDGKGLYNVSKGDDGTIYVTDIKIIGNRKTSKTVVKFSLEDLQKHGIKTDVTLNVIKDPT